MCRQASICRLDLPASRRQKVSTFALSARRNNGDMARGLFIIGGRYFKYRETTVVTAGPLKIRSG